MVSKIEDYFEEYKEFICCNAGCSSCCEKGDYPISKEDLKVVMLGYSHLDNESKIRVQENIKKMEKGGACPFLLDKLCSIYPYRPTICRIHGLAYLTENNIVKVPYCANEGKNYSKVYSNGEFFGEPIKENLDLRLGETRNLYDWLSITPPQPSSSREGA